MTTEAAQTVDYAPIIRADLEREVGRLIDRLRTRATDIEIGHLVGLHKGYSVLGEQPWVIAGLPVRRNLVGDFNPHAVRVYDSNRLNHTETIP